MSEMLPLLAVVNPHASGVASPHRLRADVQRALAQAGGAAEVRVTPTLDDLDAALHDADGRRLVLVGGDGGLHTLINRRPDAPLPEVALIPTGKANNVAHAFGIPTDLRAAADVAVHGRSRPVDLVDVRMPGRHVRAVEGVSAGFQAAARARYRAENSGALVSGAVAFARTLAALPHFDARVAFDDGPVRPLRFEQLFLNTLPYFAYGLRVDPWADPSDGVDEAVVLRARRRHQVVRMLLAARSGRHEAEVVRWRRADLLDPLPLAADGEPLGRTTAQLEVVPGALPLVAAVEG